ncbi:hypothetical protein HHI36_022247 [Cryptolaemus montrouzieri]|uniref:Uncharacterized protein n=1 Tax=Cryptolaemus montrouzieri TaxID=559131 RepID=A0ABD2N010_9CUCU
MCLLPATVQLELGAHTQRTCFWRAGAKISSTQEQRILSWLEEVLDQEVIVGEVDEDEGGEIGPEISEHETDIEEECESETEKITENQNMASSSEYIPLSYMQTSECYIVKNKIEKW